MRMTFPKNHLIFNESLQNDYGILFFRKSNFELPDLKSEKFEMTKLSKTLQTLLFGFVQAQNEPTFQVTSCNAGVGK